MKIELDAEQKIIVVDGLQISLDLLSSFAHPDPSKLYRMKREGDIVTVEVLEDGVAPKPEPCDSVFQEITCNLNQSHIYSHMGVIYGQRIYWTDELVQCDSNTLRDGRVMDRRNNE